MNSLIFLILIFFRIYDIENIVLEKKFQTVSSITRKILECDMESC